MLRCLFVGGFSKYLMTSFFPIANRLKFIIRVDVERLMMHENFPGSLFFLIVKRLISAYANPLSCARWNVSRWRGLQSTIR